MESFVGPLIPLFQHERAANRALALAVVISTAGSTYRKPGALMLIAHDGRFAGLLSGGCLETDLLEHARAVIETGEPHTVRYEMGGPDDALWGLGVGCEGAMRIFLLQVGPANDWQPLDHFIRGWTAHARTSAAIVIESSETDAPAGSVWIHNLPRARSSRYDAQIDDLLNRANLTGDAGWFDSDALPPFRAFALSLALPPRVLLLGGGPDALPVVDLGTRLGWKVTVYDHRPAYAQRAHFPAAERVVLARADEARLAIDLSSYDAAVVMSHHLTSDLQYLQALTDSTVRYVGLLGPPIRREKLLSDLGADRAKLAQRLHAPVGLALGGRSPESIALSIVSEIHAVLHGEEGGAFSEAVKPRESNTALP